jgi:hypothetical protein
MKSTRFLFVFSLLIIVGFLLASCAPAPTPTPTTTALPTETKVIPTATNTSLPTSTITIAPTATVTLNPTPDLSGISVLGAGPDNGFYLVNFFKPGLATEYLVITDTGIPFNCKTYSEYPDRLICYGPMLPWGEKVQFQFIDPSTGQTVYTLPYTLPDHDWGFATSKLYWCVDPNMCPERGQKFSCETEIRYDSHHLPCIWSTCVDACGYCTSINTCDNQ